jgi:hypothetical protein
VPPEPKAPLRAAIVAAALAFGALLVACDAWVKVLARIAGCRDSSLHHGWSMQAVWEIPRECEGVALVSGLDVVPAARAGSLVPFAGDLAVASDGRLWALVLVAIATVATIVLVAWRQRIPGDLFAAATLWAGVTMHAAPRLAGRGGSVTELQIGAFATGLGDVVIAWASLWIVWRIAAEIRG